VSACPRTYLMADAHVPNRTLPGQTLWPGTRPIHGRTHGSDPTQACLLQGVQLQQPQQIRSEPSSPAAATSSRPTPTGAASPALMEACQHAKGGAVQGLHRMTCSILG
jgi:hypothetical protein